MLEKQDVLLSRRDLLKYSTATAIGICVGSLALPKSAYADFPTAPNSKFDLTKIQDPEIREEWRTVIENMQSDSQGQLLELELVDISKTSPARIGEIETINIRYKASTGTYYGHFLFYCHYRAMLNSNGVKVFDEIIDTGVAPDSDQFSVEVTYSENNIIDSRRTCVNLIAGTFGLRNSLSVGSGLTYYNQALAVEYYAPYGSGQVLLP